MHRIQTPLTRNSTKVQAVSPHPLPLYLKYILRQGLTLMNTYSNVEYRKENVSDRGLKGVSEHSPMNK